LSNPSRRQFLICTGISTSLFLLDPLGKASLSASSEQENYYQSNSERIIADFEETIGQANLYLKSRYRDQSGNKICVEARSEFKHLFAGLPYIGGDKHPGTKWIILAGHWISFLRPMAKRGYPTKETAQMMYDLYVDYLNTLPKEKIVKKGRYMFTQDYMNIMKNWAHKSKEQRVDWVGDFIPGDEKSFDWGIDYHYCPCFEVFKTQGASDIAPYFCLVDFPEHKLMSTGRVRTKTLAQGDEVCNFRYKKDRAVTQNWSTEITKFKG
jgi:hypothetical protein